MSTSHCFMCKHQLCMVKSCKIRVLHSLVLLNPLFNTHDVHVFSLGGIERTGHRGQFDNMILTPDGHLKLLDFGSLALSSVKNLWVY